MSAAQDTIAPSHPAAVVMPAQCGTWDGGGVAAVFCDPDKLKGTEPASDNHPGRGVTLSGPGLRSGTAVGLAQAVGAPLGIGQTLTISGATHASSRSVLFVSGEGIPAGPNLWPVPALKVGFAVGGLAGGRGKVTFGRSGLGLRATLRDGSGRVIQPGYVDAVVAPKGGPQILFAYFIGQIAIEDNPRYQNCDVNVVSGRVTASPASKGCKALQDGLKRYAKQPVTIHGSTATINQQAAQGGIKHFRKVAGRWYLVVTRA
jgi:hypothetical protein